MITRAVDTGNVFTSEYTQGIAERSGLLRRHAPPRPRHHREGGVPTAFMHTVHWNVGMPQTSYDNHHATGP